MRNQNHFLSLPSSLLSTHSLAAAVQLREREGKTIIDALHTPPYTSLVPGIRHITPWSSENLEQNQGTTWVNQILGQAQLASI
jgi:hypothetical protein